MSTSTEEAYKQLNLFRMCAEIDLCLRKIKKRNIFIVGLSRTGKSTLFNNINNVTLIGTAPQGSAGFQLLGIGNIQAQYKVLVENAEKVGANGGIASVTLYPNILDKGNYTMSDMAGYMDTRRYKEVMGVSYVLKGAFHQVQECQFALVVSKDFFGVPKELFNSLKGFLKMFNFSEMTSQTKLRLFRSMTFVITKAPKNAPATAYASVMKNFIPQVQNPIYGGSNDVVGLTQILTYLSQHPQQFYLFEAAVINEKAPPSTIVQDHFDKRTYFELKKENQEFLNKNKKEIFNLPFQQDFNNMPIKEDQENLKRDLEDKIKTVPEIAQILQKFFKKAIVPENLLSQNLSFSEQFKQMSNFINDQKNDIYPKQFNNRCQGIDKNTFPTIFSPQDPPKPLKIGIVLAQNAFGLYKLFNQWPVYEENKQKRNIVEKFMADYRDHLVTIIKVFRDSFCSTYNEEQIIIKFLFIAARICREFSMLYQIRPDGKDLMCETMKDSFQKIIQKEPYKDIQKKFVVQINKNIEKICKKIINDPVEAKKYSKYLNMVPLQQGCAQIQDMPEYKAAKRKILQIVGSQASSPQEALLATYENFVEHKKKIEEVLNTMNDDEEQTYPDDVNFQSVFYLKIMASIILNLQRADNYAEDIFAYDRVKGREQKDESIRLKLIIQQAFLAMDIFIYINDVESVCKAYEVVIKNIPQKDYYKLVKYYKGLALYCSKNGRIDQSIDLYQKAMSICMTGNLWKQFKVVKDQLLELQNNRNERLKNYFSNLKLKKIIDPTDDAELEKITQDLEELFIEPYRNYKMRQPQQ